ncbi:MAG: nickel pincer cofactor biosynthesis protein LarB [Magnetococcales bacterium]|nr:nickel pincer cofactor biosynthesis protein LarB [Magnetococcales bacterium]
MKPERMRQLLDAVASGSTSVESAMQSLRGFPAESIEENGQTVVRLDTQREMRHGFPEVIFGQGKRFEHLKAATERALSHEGGVLVTRVGRKKGEALAAANPGLTYHQAARCLYRRDPERIDEGLVAVISAGASDFGVAEEAACTARTLGARVETHYDSGVAGLHRILSAGELLRTARAFVVVAGMEGALPSVVGGLVNRPVIAVPTSQGYGASFGGLSALLGMLNSCASNVTTVNIDNGFGAGYVAALINRQA